MIALLATLALGQMTVAQTAELRKFRYGKTAAQIETMGLDAYQRFFETRTPDGTTALYRGVSYGVYVDAYRENTGRRFRSPLPSATQTRLLALDKQMRFIDVLFARNDWLFTGGNAVDPEGDTLEFARAERDLYTLRTLAPDLTRMRRRLATYRSETLEKSRKEELSGAMGGVARGRAEIRSNLGKLDAAVIRATGLCRTASERAVLFGFVADQAKERL